MATAIKITSKLARQLVVPRKASSKKGDNGIILVVGGSRFYHGAPVLTSMAALRTGADLVYTAVPRSVIVPVRSYSPAIIALPMPDDKLTVGAANRIAAMVPKKADAAAIGMGMSIAKPEALVTLVAKLKNAGTKLLLDASALIPEVLKEAGDTGTIVTPHAGEYRRLFQTDAGKTTDERAANVQKMAQEHGVTILLKGPVDIVSDGKRVGLNSTHNPAMTVGGTGDVLSGITVSLMTRIEPFNAALLAAYFNGLAGNLAYKQVGLHMTSDDLVGALPSAIKPFDRIVR